MHSRCRPSSARGPPFVVVVIHCHRSTWSSIAAYHRCLSCIAFLSSSCCRSRSSSSATDLWKGLSRVALRRRRDMVSLSSLSVFHHPSSVQINHTYMISATSYHHRLIISSYPRRSPIYRRGPLHIPAQACISPPNRTHSITIALSPDDGDPTPARQLTLTPPPLKPPIRSPPSPSNLLRAVTLLPPCHQLETKMQRCFFFPSYVLFKRLELQYR